MADLPDEDASPVCRPPSPPATTTTSSTTTPPPAYRPPAGGSVMVESVDGRRRGSVRGRGALSPLQYSPPPPDLRPLHPGWRLPVHRREKPRKLHAETLLKIFVLVLLEDGDPAIRTLALTCKRFWEVVREDYFLQEAHFAWLDTSLCYR